MPMPLAGVSTDTRHLVRGDRLRRCAASGSMRTIPGAGADAGAAALV